MTGFAQAVAFVLEHEGGYVNDPRDPGGETNYGISKRSYPHLNIRNLTRPEAVSIYKRDYWNRIAADKLSPRLAFCAFDTSVNLGVHCTLEFLERTHDPLLLLGLRLAHYAALTDWDIYGKGWTRRVADLTRALGMDELPAYHPDTNAPLGSASIVTGSKVYPAWLKGDKVHTAARGLVALIKVSATDPHEHIPSKVRYAALELGKLLGGTHV